MKSLLFLLSFALLLASCTSASDIDVIDTPSAEEQQMCPVSLTLDFVTSETSWSASADTRATSDGLATTRAASLTPATRIALRIFREDGTAALDQINQTQGDADFGTFSGLRLAPGAYKCVIIAHRASAADKPAATITSLTSASIPETDLWDTFATVYDLTVAAGSYTAQEHTITVPLCVTRLYITLLDAIAAGVSKIRLTLNAGASTTASAPIALNPTTGLATTDLVYTRTWDINPQDIGKTNGNFTITGLMNQYPKTCDAKVEALSSDGTPIYTRTLQNITFNRGKVRKVSTNLFTGSVDATINFEDWTDDDPIVIP